jgi:hypothetical protein
MENQNCHYIFIDGELPDTGEELSEMGWSVERVVFYPGHEPFKQLALVVDGEVLRSEYRLDQYQGVLQPSGGVQFLIIT